MVQTSKLYTVLMCCSLVCWTTMDYPCTRLIIIFLLTGRYPAYNKVIYLSHLVFYYLKAAMSPVHIIVPILWVSPAAGYIIGPVLCGWWHPRKSKIRQSSVPLWCTRRILLLSRIWVSLSATWQLMVANRWTSQWLSWQLGHNDHIVLERGLFWL